MKKIAFPARTIAFDALLVALYVVLGFIKIPIGNILRINLAPFTVVVGAILLGPVNGFLVGFLGEFLSQILGPYGLTPTTLLWAMPEAVRGLLQGLVFSLYFGKKHTMIELMKSKQTTLYLLSCVLIGIVASLVNTFALYVDSKLFGYYNYYMVFGILAVRLGLAVAISGALGYLALLIGAALQRNKLIS